MKKLYIILIGIIAIFVNGCESQTERCLKEGYTIEQCNQQKIANTQAQAYQNSNTNSALMGAMAGAAATHLLNRNNPSQHVIVQQPQPQQPQTVINKTYNYSDNGQRQNAVSNVAKPSFGTSMIPQSKPAYKPIVTNPPKSTSSSRFSLTKSK